MLGKTKKIMAIAAALVVMSSTSVFATENYEPVAKKVQVNGAGIHFKVSANENDLQKWSEVNDSVFVNRNNSIDLENYTIDMSKDFREKTQSEYVRVDDNRGTNQGWNVKICATDLTANVIDRTVSPNVGAKVTIPAASVLQVKKGKDVEALFKTKGYGVKTDLPESYTPVTNSGVSVLSSQAGYGAGIYTVGLNLSFTMPKYLPHSATVASGNPGNSKIDTTNANHKWAEDMGIFEGTYTTTISYAVSTNP